MQKLSDRPEAYSLCKLEPGYDYGMFGDGAIDKFIAIYEKKCEEPISRTDAVAMATRLVNLNKVLNQPIPPEKMKEFLGEDSLSETPE